MANPNPSTNPISSPPSNSVSPAMDRLRALQKLRTPNPAPLPTPATTFPVITPIETEEEIDWESLFAASTKKDDDLLEIPSSSLTPINSGSENSTMEQGNPFLVDELDFLPPIKDEELDQKIIQEEISQSLSSISTPNIVDSSDFFAPPFEVLNPVSKPVVINSQPIPVLIDQIRLNPEVQESGTDQLKIIQSSGSYPLTLTEDPSNPNPITQMLKKLQGQFGSRISDAMLRTRKKLAETTKSFNNRAGDASNLESSLFGN